MKRIIVDFRPFVVKQNVQVYQDGNCIETATVEVSRIVDVVTGLKNKYNVDQITLCGNQDYLNKFKAELNTKFADNNCDIEIIRR